MNTITRKQLALGLGIIGSILFGYGIIYNLTHLLQSDASKLLSSLFIVGYLLLAAVPLILKIKWLSIFLFGLAALYMLIILNANL